MSTTEPIRAKSDLMKLSNYFLEKKQYRNHVLIVLGTHTALRIGDLLRLKWDDVYDERNNRFRTHIHLTEHKTKKPKTIAINHEAIEALRLYFPHRRGAFIFASRWDDSHPISRHQAWKIIHRAASDLSIPGVIAPHSLRKSWGHHAYSEMDVSLAILMEAYQHENYATFRRYLGITQDELDQVYLKMNLF